MYVKHHVLLTAIGVYSYNTKDPEAVQAWETIHELVHAEPWVLQMHGFYLDHATKTIRFDVVVSFDAEDRAEVYRRICEKVQAAYPDYQLQIIMDTDFSGESEQKDER